MEPDSQTVKLELRDRVAVVTLDDPETLNALGNRKRCPRCSRCGRGSRPMRAAASSC